MSEFYAQNRKKTGLLENVTQEYEMSFRANIDDLRLYNKKVSYMY